MYIAPGVELDSEKRLFWEKMRKEVFERQKSRL